MARENFSRGDQEELTALVGESERVAVFTGAGISTESGIPDFRSLGGVWEKYDPNEFHIDRFLSSPESRRRYWQRTTAFYEGMRNAQPNAGHLALVELERMGKLQAVITQNVDGLHQMAGTTPDRVIELHGTARRVHCLDCGHDHPREEFQAWVTEDGEAPDCEQCGGLMKPATISFGQSLREEDLSRAAEATMTSDLFLVVGSSLVVYPAAGFPVMAAQQGTPLVIVNIQETPHDALAQVVVHASAGETLLPVVERLAGRSIPVAMPS